MNYKAFAIFLFVFLFLSIDEIAGQSPHETCKLIKRELQGPIGPPGPTGLEGNCNCSNKKMKLLDKQVQLLKEQNKALDRRLDALKARRCGDLASLTACAGRWTRFSDRDNPSGKGDYELLSTFIDENPGQACDKPTAIDARVVRTHTHYTQTGQVVTVNLKWGFRCVNAEQKGQSCLDYEVRFWCP